jgi:hypothetical protein
MPRFLDPNAEELNSLRRPKMRMTKNLKRQYRGTETSLQIQGDILDKYNRMYESMVSITTSLSEILNQLKLGFEAPQAYGSRAMDRYLGVVSNVSRELARLLLFMSQEVPSLSIFQTEQIQSLAGMNDQMVSVVEQIDQISKSMPPTSLGKFREILRPLIREVGALQAKLEGINTPGGRGSLTEFGRDPSTYVAPRRGRPRVNFPAGTGDTGDDGDDGSQPPQRPRPKRAKKGKVAAAGDTEGSGYSFDGLAAPHKISVALPMAVGGAYTHTRFL